MSTKETIHKESKEKVAAHRAQGLGKRILKRAAGRAPTSYDRFEASRSKPGSFARLAENVGDTVRTDMRRLPVGSKAALELQRKIGASNISEQRVVGKWEKTIQNVFEYLGAERPQFENKTVVTPKPELGFVKEATQDVLRRLDHNFTDVILGSGPTPIPVRETVRSSKVLSTAVGLFVPDRSSESGNEGPENGIGIYVDNPSTGISTAVLTEQDIATMPPQLHEDFELVTELFRIASGRPGQLPATDQKPSYAPNIAESPKLYAVK